MIWLQIVVVWLTACLIFGFGYFIGHSFGYNKAFDDANKILKETGHGEISLETGSKESRG